MRPHRVLLVTVEQLELSILWSVDKQELTRSRQQCLCKACDSDIVKTLWFAAYTQGAVLPLTNSHDVDM